MLDMSLSVRSLGRHCVEDMLEALVAGFSLAGFLDQKLRSPYKDPTSWT